MRTRCLVLVLAMIASCDKNETKKADPVGSAQAAPTEASVAIFVDDQQVGKLAATQVKLWPRLDTLVPVAVRKLGTWEKITLKGKSSVDVQQPSTTHPELVPAIFPGDGGAPAFGMFDPVELAKHGKPALREDAIIEVRIKLAQGGTRGQNEHGEGGDGDPTKLALRIKTASGEQVVKGEK